MCGDQDALPLREQMGDEHRGRMSFSGTRRALDECLSVRIDLAQDPQLHVVDGEREERVLVDAHQSTVTAFPRRIGTGVGNVIGIDERRTPPAPFRSR